MRQTKPEVAVIGAGPAGLSCAAELVRAGFRPVVYEKSRGFGGRVATRRRGGLHVDHGAQFLSGRTGVARRLIDAARAAGQALPWPAGTASFGEDAWIGMPGMKDLLSPLSSGLEIGYSSLVTDLHEENGRWQVVLEDGTAASFDRVAVAVPAPQVLRFMDVREGALRSELERVRFSSSCALMIDFEARPDWGDIEMRPGAPFDLILRDSSKPGRPEDMECWLALADDAWSKAHSDDSLDDVGRRLLDDLKGLKGPLPAVRTMAGHRWRFSRAEAPLGKSFAETVDGRVLIGGDWALGATIEDALESGHKMALAIIERR